MPVNGPDSSKPPNPAVSWDYTELAPAYNKRPGYSSVVLDALAVLARLGPGAAVCDIGAGTGHLTVALAGRGAQVTSIEPNAAMRAVGVERTRDMANVRWREGTGEATGQPTGAFRFAGFGSSFNVVDRERALAETHRILEPGGSFACLWNHRDLADPLQRDVEGVIRRHLPDFDYGVRRQDQSAVIRRSGLFKDCLFLSADFVHPMSGDDALEAWRSHGTLQRQAGPRFPAVLDAIAEVLAAAGPILTVPYTTVAWHAKRA
jgi:ubiquinone/menaquinone biosynthesis C-methylase UbiE